MNQKLFFVVQWPESENSFISNKQKGWQNILERTLHIKLKMDSFKNSENLIKRKSTTELFVDDFETQNWELSNKTKDSVSKYRFQFNALYTLDLIICHVFIGKYWAFHVDILFKNIMFLKFKLWFILKYQDVSQKKCPSRCWITLL